MARGASPAVVRALYSDEPVAKESVVKCAMCGDLVEFTRRDPSGLGRSMQGCSNPRCPDHASRPMPTRRL